MPERASQPPTLWEIVNSRPVLSQVAVLFVGYLVASFGGCVTMPGDVAAVAKSTQAEVDKLKTEVARIDKLTAKIDELQQSIANLNATVARMEGVIQGQGQGRWRGEDKGSGK